MAAAVKALLANISTAVVVTSVFTADPSQLVVVASALTASTKNDLGR
jgi:hypothetical protein